jgi:tryptophan aminotransferase
MFFHEVRAVLHLEQTPGLISLLAGKPHSSTFPFTSFNFSVRDPIDPQKEVPVQLTPEELQLGLQYSPGKGIPALLEWLYGLQEVAQGRKKDEGWEITIGNGSQDLIYKVYLLLRLLLSII